jgi:DNA polymerase III subunit epsilon
MTARRGRDEVIAGFTELVRAKVGNIRAAIETLEAYPGADAARTAQLRAVILDEAGALSRALEEADEALAAAGDRRRRLEGVAASELLVWLARRLSERPGVTIEVDAPAAAVRVAADQPALAEALGRVLERLGDDFGVRGATLRLRAEEGFATLDLVWSTAGTDVETVFAWQSGATAREDDPMGAALRQVARRHRGESWFNLDRGVERAYLRLLLPLAAAGASLAADEKRRARPKRPRPR